MGLGVQKAPCGAEYMMYSYMYSRIYVCNAVHYGYMLCVCVCVCVCMGVCVWMWISVSGYVVESISFYFHFPLLNTL